MERTVNALLAEMDKMPVIDAHEHLPVEAEILASEADVLTRIYCHYAITHAVSAGLSEDRNRLKDTRIPLERRWQMLRPFLSAIEDTGYARAARIAARDLHGIDEINDNTYLLLSQRLEESNRPGIYGRILKDKCHIERIINQGDWSDGKDGYAVGVRRDFVFLHEQTAAQWRQTIGDLARGYGGPFEDASTLIGYWVESIIRDGAVGLKFPASMPMETIDDGEADALVARFSAGGLTDPQGRALGAWLMHKAVELGTTHGLVIAIHCGIMWCCWEDFRAYHPKNIVPLLVKHRHATFDLYHGGIPWVREMAVIGNQYPNANLNLVWCHQISPYMTEQMLNEWIDLVPANKIIGFGGDNAFGPEASYGALRLAKENIARALALRLGRRQMSESRAVEIARQWLYDNPKRIYGLV